MRRLKDWVYRTVLWLKHMNYPPRVQKQTKQAEVDKKEIKELERLTK